METTSMRNVQREAEIDARIRRIEEANRKRQARRKEVEQDRMSEMAAGSDAARVSVYVRCHGDPVASAGGGGRSAQPPPVSSSLQSPPAPPPLCSPPSFSHPRSRPGVGGVRTHSANEHRAIARDRRTAAPPAGSGRKQSWQGVRRGTPPLAASANGADANHFSKCGPQTVRAEEHCQHRLVQSAGSCSDNGTAWSHAEPDAVKARPAPLATSGPDDWSARAVPLASRFRRKHRAPPHRDPPHRAPPSRHEQQQQQREQTDSNWQQQQQQQTDSNWQQQQQQQQREQTDSNWQQQQQREQTDSNWQLQQQQQQTDSNWQQHQQREQTDSNWQLQPEKLSDRHKDVTRQRELGETEGGRVHQPPHQQAGVTEHHSADNGMTQHQQQPANSHPSSNSNNRKKQQQFQQHHEEHLQQQHHEEHLQQQHHEEHLQQQHHEEHLQQQQQDEDETVVDQASLDDIVAQLSDKLNEASLAGVDRVFCEMALAAAMSDDSDYDGKETLVFTRSGDAAASANCALAPSDDWEAVAVSAHPLEEPLLLQPDCCYLPPISPDHSVDEDLSRQQQHSPPVCVSPISALLAQSRSVDPPATPAHLPLDGSVVPADDQGAVESSQFFPRSGDPTPPVDDLTGDSVSTSCSLGLAARKLVARQSTEADLTYSSIPPRCSGQLAGDGIPAPVATTAQTPLYPSPGYDYEELSPASALHYTTQGAHRPPLFVNSHLNPVTVPDWNPTMSLPPTPLTPSCANGSPYSGPLAPPYNGVGPLVSGGTTPAVTDAAHPHALPYGPPSQPPPPLYLSSDAPLALPTDMPAYMVAAPSFPSLSLNQHTPPNHQQQHHQQHHHQQQHHQQPLAPHELYSRMAGEFTVYSSSPPPLLAVPTYSSQQHQQQLMSAYRTDAASLKQQRQQQWPAYDQFYCFVAPPSNAPNTSSSSEGGAERRQVGPPEASSSHSGRRALVARREAGLRAAEAAAPCPEAAPLQSVTFIDGKRVETAAVTDKLLAKNRDVRLSDA